jgi:NADPH-dependent dioxygenase
MREDQTDVLVAGAGPVGLLTALLLAEAGLDVRIIDRENRTTARSYACALHPQTLKLLQRSGLVESLLDQGRRVQKVAFYDGASRRAELDLGKVGGDFPFLLILPQSLLESALEQRLREKAGVSVDWNHRFDSFEAEADEIVVNIEELGGSAAGYIVPHWETVVKNRTSIRAGFLVGADGHGSLVRRRLGLEYEKVSGPEFFAAYEFESDSKAEDEVRVVLDETTTNVLWPLPGNKCRWTFQLVKSHTETEFPEKERRAARFSPKAVEDSIRDYVQKVATHRAPWFSAAVTKITWCTEVVFEQRLVKQYGRDRCWLVGDAAHQTGPVGVQSMNVGFSEAEALATALHKILRESGSQSLLRSFNEEQTKRWRRLLGMAGGLKSTNETPAWVRERTGRILPCLPGSDGGLNQLASQLALDFG